MPTFTATAEPSNVPPRVRLNFDTGDVNDVFGTLEVRRNGEVIRAQPPVGSSVSVAYDYEAPFGDPQTYTVEGTILAAGSADWTENWASLAAWTGDTGSWSVAAGKASSTVSAAQIVRSSSGIVQRVDVATPTQVRVELLDSSNTVVASVQTDSAVTLATAAGVAQVAGSGGYSLVLSGGVATVTGATWSASKSYTGTPVKVRLVALGPSAILATSWSTTNPPSSVSLAGSSNVFAYDQAAALVRRWNVSGGSGTSFAVAAGGFSVTADSSGNFFLSDGLANLVRKYNSSGVAGITISSPSPRGVAVDSSGNIYVCDASNKLIRKYNSSGVAGITFSTTGQPWGVAVDLSGNIYVCDITSNVIRKYNSSGTQTASWSTTGQPRAVAVDGPGNVYVADSTNKVIRKFTNAGVAIATWSTGGGYPAGVALDGSGNVYVADSTNSKILKFTQVGTSIGQIIETPLGTTVDYTGSSLVTLDVLAAWLIHPGFPDLSTCIDVGRQREDGLYVEASSAAAINRGRKGEVFSPIGRPVDVVVTNGERRRGDWSLVLCAPRLEDRDAIRAELADQTPVLLRVPPSFGLDLDDGYYSVGDWTDQRTLGKGSKIRRLLTLPLTPVDPPLVSQAAEWTWGDVVSNYATWNDVRAAFPTWLDVLVGPQ